MCWVRRFPRFSMRSSFRPTWATCTGHHGPPGCWTRSRRVATATACTATMRARPDTSLILDRVIRIGREHSQDNARTTDIVHFDLSPANVLQRDGQLAGIIDWNVPFDGAGQGDRGFDVATLLFYTYDNDATRGALWDRVIGISGPRWAAVYLAHLVLRQVEWTVRHRPGGEEEHRFISISKRVLADCEHITRWPRPAARIRCRPARSAPHRYPGD